MKNPICPSCGHTAKFRVTCITKAELDGGELLPLDGKLIIDDDGLCECSNCDYTAPLPEFQTCGVPTTQRAPTTRIKKFIELRNGDLIDASTIIRVTRQDTTKSEIRELKRAPFVVVVNSTSRGYVSMDFQDRLERDKYFAELKDDVLAKNSAG